MPYRFTFILLLLCNSIFSNAKAYSEHILFRNYAEQSRYRDSLIGKLSALDDSTKILAELRGQQQWATDKDDQPLKYGLLITEYMYKTSRNMISIADLEQNITALTELLRNDHLPMLEAEALNVVNQACWDRKKYALSFEYCMKAYNLYSSWSLQEFPQKAEYTSAFGGKYFHFKDYATATKYMIEALRAAEFKSITNLNTTALCYVNRAMYDSAAYYFNRALALAEKEHDEGWVGLLSGNIGYMYYSAHNYEKALPLLEKELKINLEEHKGDAYNAANTLAILANIHLSQSNKELALKMAKQALDLVRSRNKELPYQMILGIYPVLARSYAANGNMAEAYHYLDSAGIARDTIVKRTNILILSGAQHNIDADKHLAELQKYERDQKIHLLIRNSLIAGIVMIIAIGILLINRQKLKYKQRQQQLEADKQKAEAELKQASGQLTAFTQSISEKNELIDKFAVELERIQKHAEAGVVLNTKAMQQLQQATILTDTQWHEFVHMFEKVHRGFTKRLQQKVPGLSPIDIRFMLLSKLKLTAREMASIMGVSTEAVRQNRERLRHKLGLHNGEAVLEDFADTI